jgi:hypothetical protein
MPPGMRETQGQDGREHGEVARSAHDREGGREAHHQQQAEEPPEPDPHRVRQHGERPPDHGDEWGREERCGEGLRIPGYRLIPGQQRAVQVVARVQARPCRVVVGCVRAYRCGVEEVGSLDEAGDVELSNEQRDQEHAKGNCGPRGPAGWDRPVRPGPTAFVRRLHQPPGRLAVSRSVSRHRGHIRDRRPEPAARRRVTRTSGDADQRARPPRPAPGRPNAAEENEELVGQVLVAGHALSAPGVGSAITEEAPEHAMIYL